MSSGTILVGVDGGGTGCRARAVAGAGVIGAGTAGPANIYSDLPLATRSVIAAVRAALAAGGLGDDALARCNVGLGLAGANVPTAAAAFLAEPLPFAAVALEQDSWTACRGAHGDADGAVAIIGTGTAYVARRGDTFTAFGGWGYAVSDHGSGGDLGRAALAAALLAHDGIGPSSTLTDRILAAFGGPEALAHFAVDATPAAFGRYAPAVMDAADAGDPVARALVATALDVIEPALARLLALGAPTIAAIGGLAPRYRPYLSGHIAARLVAPQGDALDGALLLARTLP